MKIIFLLFFVVLLAQNTVDGQGLWEQIKGVGCLTTISPKLTDKCVKAYDRELESRPDYEKDNKAKCCSFLAFQSCVVKISEDECGKDGEAVAKSFMKTINRGITSDECIDYGFITCITLTQIAFAAIVALALMALLSCICCCCCRR